MIWTSLIAQSKRRLWMSLFIAILIALVYFHFSRFYEESAFSWLFSLGWIPVGFNLMRAGLGLLYRLDRHPFRMLDLGLSSDQVAPGNAFEIEIRAEARRAAELRKLSAELRCTRQKSTEKGRQRSVLQSEEQILEALKWFGIWLSVVALELVLALRPLLMGAPSYQSALGLDLAPHRVAGPGT